MANRFRGFLPVVIDVETGGFNATTDALLEIAATVVEMDERGFIHPGHTESYHIKPFEGANIEQAAIDFIGIDPSTHCGSPSQKKMPSTKFSAPSERR